MDKKKVLILGTKLMHYRIPILNIVAEEYDLTLIYSLPRKASENEIEQCKFNTRFIPV